MSFFRRDEPREEELAALADGSLPDARREAVEALVDGSPELQARLEEQRRAVALVRGAAREVEAPAGLRARVEAQRRPRARRRPLLLGAGVATAGARVVVFDGVFKTGVGIVYSPVIAFTAAGAVLVGLYWLSHRRAPSWVSTLFGRLQVLSSAYMAFSHGSNDGQKTMGIIALALFTYGALGQSFYVPLWVIITCALAMGMGTAAGGWRIIRTMGFRLTELRPVEGFAAETAAGTVIEVATRFGVPISTTHAINGAILGVGSVRGHRRVRWQIAGGILTAWVLTFPAAFALGYLLVSVARMVGLTP
jgi:PiT family inorganic phosphate transporter